MIVVNSVTLMMYMYCTLIVKSTSLGNQPHTVVTLVRRSRDNTTFDITIQRLRQCPLGYFLYTPSPGEFYREDGTEMGERFCVKCSNCEEGLKVKRTCSAYHDVICDRNCRQPGYRYDEATKSCKRRKVLDEDSTRDKPGDWSAEQNQINATEDEVAEVGSLDHGAVAEATSVYPKTSLNTRWDFTHPAESDFKGDLAISDPREVNAEGKLRSIDQPNEADLPEIGMTLQYLLLIASVCILIPAVMCYVSIILVPSRCRCIPSRRRRRGGGGGQGSTFNHGITEVRLAVTSGYIISHNDTPTVTIHVSSTDMGRASHLLRPSEVSGFRSNGSGTTELQISDGVDDSELSSSSDADDARYEDAVEPDVFDRNLTDRGKKTLSVITEEDAEESESSNPNPESSPKPG